MHEHSFSPGQLTKSIKDMFLLILGRNTCQISALEQGFE